MPDKMDLTPSGLEEPSAAAAGKGREVDALIEEVIIAAYWRGFEYRHANGNDKTFLTNAGRDFADYIMHQEGTSAHMLRFRLQPAAAVERPTNREDVDHPSPAVPGDVGWRKRNEQLPKVGGTYLVGAYDETMGFPRSFVRFWASFFLLDTGPEWQIRDAEHEHRVVEYWIDLPPHPEHAMLSASPSPTKED
jgi:hypothetical protein